MLGTPIDPEKLVMKFVSKLGFFLPIQYPTPIIKKTGKITSTSFARIASCMDEFAKLENIFID